jgi:hypothetical protein
MGNERSAQTATTNRTIGSTVFRPNGFLLIQIFLEADEDSSNVLRLAQVSHRVGN